MACRWQAIPRPWFTGRATRSATRSGSLTSARFWMGMYARTGAVIAADYRAVRFQAEGVSEAGPHVIDEAG